MLPMFGAAAAQESSRAKIFRGTVSFGHVFYLHVWASRTSWEVYTKRGTVLTFTLPKIRKRERSTNIEHVPKLVDA